jgi:hypothetical protein
VESAGGQDPRPEATAAFQEFFGTRSEGAIHPVTGAAFAGTGESDALDFEFCVEPVGEIDALGEHVSAEGRRMDVFEAESLGKFGENFGGEKGDLSFVIGFEVEEPVAFDPAAG